MSFSPKIEVISNLAILGEGPHWNVETQDLLYVDIPGKSVHRYDPKTKEDFELIIDEGRVSLIVPVEGQKGKYIIGVERDLYLLEWDGRSKVRSGFKKLTTVDEHEKDNRFNDGKCDPQGRLWAG